MKKTHFKSKYVCNNILLIALTALSNSSYANNNSGETYFKISGGYSHMENYKPRPNHGAMEPIGIDVMDKGYAVGASIGKSLGYNVSGELELAYRRHYFTEFKLIRDFPVRNFKKGQVIKLGKEFGYVHSYSLMANLNYNFVNNSNFTPFIGAGIGVIRYEERNTCGNFTTYQPGFQVTPGLNIAINDKISLDLSYRYLKMKDSNIDNNCLSPKVKYAMHEGVIGLKYNFN